MGAEQENAGQTQPRAPHPTQAIPLLDRCPCGWGRKSDLSKIQASACSAQRKAAPGLDLVTNRALLCSFWTAKIHDTLFSFLPLLARLSGQNNSAATRVSRTWWCAEAKLYLSSVRASPLLGSPAQPENYTGIDGLPG